jgi:hypothetical protein
MSHQIGDANHKLVNCSIPKTITLLTHCWKDAEEATSDHLHRQNPKSNEEFITSLFWGYLNVNLQNAVKDSRLRSAFESDLLAAIPELRYDSHKLRHLSHHLFMDCQLMDKSVERKTGGDFGLTVIHPEITNSYSCSEIRMHRQGLLCQAKLRRKTGKWGVLSKRQQLVLPENLAFTSLVLYQFETLQRSRLKPFGWQACAGVDIGSVGSWLKSDSFPQILSSGAAIWQIAKGLLGTSDEGLIDRKIAITKRPQVTIRIDWPDDERPSFVQIENHIKVHQQQHVFVQH